MTDYHAIPKHLTERQRHEFNDPAVSIDQRERMQKEIKRVQAERKKAGMED